MRRLRYRYFDDATNADEDGPFVSFTDLFVGILFLFLILVAALMLLEQASVRMAKQEATSKVTEIAQLQSQVKGLTAKLDGIAKLDREDPPFRLAIAYNEYSSDALTSKTDPAPLEFVRSVRIFRSSSGQCISERILEAANTGWMKIDPKDIPNSNNEMSFRRIGSCSLSPGGIHYGDAYQTVDISRTSMELYEGFVTLHPKEPSLSKSVGRFFDQLFGNASTDTNNDVLLRVQYQILGIYDDEYKKW